MRTFKIIQFNIDIATIPLLRKQSKNKTEL